MFDELNLFSKEILDRIDHLLCLYLSVLFHFKHLEKFNNKNTYISSSFALWKTCVFEVSVYACVLYKGQYFTELPKYEMWKGNREGPYCLYVEKCMIHFRERERERERERSGILLYASSFKYLTVQRYIIIIHMPVLS